MPAGVSQLAGALKMMHGRGVYWRDCKVAACLYLTYLVLESQLPHKPVDLTMEFVIVRNKLMVLRRG